jgi:N-acetyltransferase
MLSGRHVRLEPLQPRHIDGLVVAAATADKSIYRWSRVPSTIAEATHYVKTAISWRDDDTAVPFATVRADNGMVIGSTRFWKMERWEWPVSHPSHNRGLPDVCEIGHTWLTREALRTGANTEAKLLMLTQAFETWHVLRVCLHSDSRNERSRAAIERIGGRFEGILRAHRMDADDIPRDSARYSILASEWPAVKLRIGNLLERKGETP